MSVAGVGIVSGKSWRVIRQEITGLDLPSAAAQAQDDVPVVAAKAMPDVSRMDAQTLRILVAQLYHDIDGLEAELDPLKSVPAPQHSATSVPKDDSLEAAVPLIASPTTGS